MNFSKSLVVLLGLVSCLPFLQGQEPELSADQPITYQADQALLIAEGNAIYSDGKIRVVADRIEFFRDKGFLKASGNVSVTREGTRLVTQWAEYNTETRDFKCGPFRAGSPPYFLEGDGFAGTPEQINFQELALYIKEPVAASPKLAVGYSEWTPGESFRGEDVSIGLPLFGGLPLPSFTFDGNSDAMEATGELGFRESLGLYARSKVLFPYSESLSIGGNLDLYSERGVLIGPAFDWGMETADGHFALSLDSGWIRDQDAAERGFDILGQAVDRERGFLGLEARYSNGGSTQFNLSLNALSDSEVLRDFRPDEFYTDYQPDAFAEFVWMNDWLALSVFARTQLNDYYSMVQRLPEVRLEGLPTKLGATDLITQWAFEFSRLRESVLMEDPSYNLFGLIPQPGQMPFPPLAEFETDTIQRIEGAFKASYPINLTPALQIIPLASVRWSHYDDDSLADNIDRFVTEAGADLSYTLAKTWNVGSKKWDIDSMRHTISGVAKYRYHFNGDDYANSISAYDRRLYNPAMPVIDLYDLRFTDTLTELNVLRWGIENRWEAKGLDGAIRTFATFNVYEDIILSDTGISEEAVYVQGSLSPMKWLRLDWEQKIRAENLQTEATFFRVALRSADQWELGLVAEYIEGSIEQYGFDAAYRLTEKNSILTSLRYDSRTDTFSRQQYGIRHRFANVWELEVYVQLNEGNNRDDDFSLGLRLKLLEF